MIQASLRRVSPALLLSAPVLAQVPTTAPAPVVGAPETSPASALPSAGARLPGAQPPSGEGPETQEALPTLPPGGIRFDRPFHIDDPDDLWVRGGTYKAGATPDGLTYVPFFGSDAPRSWPVSFRLQRASVGGTELSLDARAAVSRRGERLTLDRGPVNVHYDVAVETVEQLFTFDEAPRGGDLVLELRVSSDLTARPEGGGFVFDGPRGSVHYGAARAFDATGADVEVPAALEGDTLRLTVPGAFVETARGGLTVDPLVWTTTVDDYANDELLRPDVAYEATSNEFIVVYENQYSVGDTDIFSTSIDAVSGAETGQRFLELNTGDQRRPSVATQAADSMALCVFEAEFSGFNTRISGRLFDMENQSLGTGLVIMDETFENSAPDVGGNGTNDPNGLFLVVCLRAVDFGPNRAFMRSVGTGGALGSLFITALASNREDHEVAVSKSVDDFVTPMRWNVLAKGVDTVDGRTSLYGLRMNATGMTSLGVEQVLREFPAGTSVSEIDVSASLEATDAAGNALSPTYLVSWDVDGTDDEDTILAVCRDGAIVTTTPLQVIEHADTALDQREARLSVTRDAFAVTYLEKRPGGGLLGPYDVYMSALHLVEGTLLAVMERRLHLGDTGALFAGGAATASRRSGGYTTSRRAMSVWSTFFTNSTTATWNVDGAYYYTPVTDSVAPQYCYGTPNSTGERAFMAIFGSNDTTTPKEAVGTGLPPQQFCLLGVGTVPVQVFPVPNSSGTLCIGGQVGRFNGQIVQADVNGRVSVDIDPTSIPTPTSSVAATSGMARAFQFWYRDSAPNGSSSSNFTNGAALVFR